MIDELHARFLPRFKELARSRLARATDVGIRRDHAAVSVVARELHAIAGEAGLLGLAAVVPLARDSEAKAKQMGATRADADADALIASLRELGNVIELMGPARAPEGGSR